MQNDSLCPNCKNPLYFSLDEWGRTPWHLHCDNCHINIGTNKPKKAIELIQQYHKPKTYIEYYQNDIQLFFEGNTCIINKEK